ncbi:OmpA family protein [Pseudosulfitobacter sp. SM2401]|uniref:OmpA family protein n=1 Tax=Pseudosulfitobacter sp. SM2401 TaxID=3350098 RepID=UPI0036F3DE26
MISAKVRCGLLSLALMSVSLPAAALDLVLPQNARKTIERNSKLDSYAAPIGPFENGTLETRLIEGAVRRSAWKIASPGLTTLQVLAPLRDQLQEAGYQVVLDCDHRTCGGFDFRFGTEVMPAPSMFVNIRAYRFVLGIKGTDANPDQVVGLLVSASDTASHVQIIQAGQLDGDTGQIKTGASVPTGVTPDGTSAPFETVLLSTGSVVLDGLDFATGTSDLGAGPFPVLKSIADFLKTRDDVRVALVGHTDSVGSLDNNIALSKRRAASVRARLIETYGVAPARLDAEGMGYLSPLTSNLDKAGREANRRVEAIILPLN